MIPKMRFLYPLKRTNPVLYTADTADIIRDKQTGKEYMRGEGRVYCSSKEAIPSTIEDTEPGRWEFIRLNSKKAQSGGSTINYGRELFVQGLFRK